MRLAVARTLLGAALVTLAAAPDAAPEIRLLGVGAIPGTATDNSGLTRLLEDGATRDNQVGGLGSALAYTGVGEVYLATPDRGPADGTTTYTDRAYFVRIRLRRNPMAPDRFTVTPSVAGTLLLRSETGAGFSGSAAAFSATNSHAGRRLDPEGIRAAGCEGRFYVSDEYGPFLYEFQPTGRRRRALAIPNKFLIDLPSAVAGDELTGNLAGRQSNRGMEGLAISPDGRRLYGLMQSPLLQDGALDAAHKRVGTNARLLEVDVRSGAVREFLYTLDSPGNGLSEVLAINDHELLVLERDGKAGSQAATKKIFKIDIAGATDIRNLQQLPQTGVPAELVPVAKALFIDLLDPAFGLAGPELPEKFEGMSFGPELPDGRHLLIVATDNDFVTTQASNFYAFAIDAADLPGYTPQTFRRGACPPAAP